MSSNRYPTRSSRRLQCHKALTDHIYQCLSKKIDPKHILHATFKKNLSCCAVELLPAIEEALKNGNVKAVDPHTLPSHESPVGISAPKPQESDIYVLIDNGANDGARINESHARELLEERGYWDAERPGICQALDQVGQIQGLLSKSVGIL
ncbi:hypothetical protein BO94DRAFT_552601 [Aspergillus sclerotioniger CBS 115572]|uniref:Uncharacterized protein n=1 Tax=Aspergillus sclerotioniger CBS 115572 TaxID=1450535 RepID=A0A317XBQ9_9EURO|nr:hypothetical protein BO94DRAFT_552601 [Aspergillus sclerotioniger CBS 115572]PWY95765.1 hypothetical protein BO94DRAFT_552601 [Aspergillus sclerotioniger CBS 115572]